MLGEFLSNTLNPSEYKASDQLRSLIKELNELGESRVLFYPSSSDDYSDVLYANGRMITGLDFEFPDVYIHTDANNFVNIPTHRSLYFFRTPSFSEFFFLKIEISNKKCIRIRKFKRNGLNSEFWLIEFSGFRNEDIVKPMLSSNLNIDLLYNHCDGIFSGMGDATGGIPPLFYWILFPELGIKYSLSEYDIERLKSEVLKFQEKWKYQIKVHFPELNTDNLNLDQGLEIIDYQHDSLVRNRGNENLKMGLYSY